MTGFHELYERYSRDVYRFALYLSGDPAAADDCPERLAEIEEIESCWSVAGEESYILKIRTATPADLEELLARIRTTANVATRTTIVLSTAFENRPIS